MSPADYPIYVDLLLTALARGSTPSVVLKGDAPLPDPATLATDADERASIALAKLALDALSSEKVIQRVLEAAGFRRFQINRTEGHIRTSLEAHSGPPTDVAFRVTKRKDAYPLEIEIAPIRG